MKAQELTGKLWTAKKTDNIFIVSINDKASIADALTNFLNTLDIRSGQLYGIGATNEATLRFFDPETKEYVDRTFNEQMEISNISGNISVAQSNILLHLHATLGRKDYSTLAGHLQDAKVRGAAEIIIHPFSTELNKKMNNSIGLNLFDFKAD